MNEDTPLDCATLAASKRPTSSQHRVLFQFQAVQSAVLSAARQISTLTAGTHRESASWAASAAAAALSASPLSYSLLLLPFTTELLILAPPPPPPPPPTPPSVRAGSPSLPVLTVQAPPPRARIGRHAVWALGPSRAPQPPVPLRTSPTAIAAVHFYLLTSLLLLLSCSMTLECDSSPPHFFTSLKSSTVHRF